MEKSSRLYGAGWILPGLRCLPRERWGRRGFLAIPAGQGGSGCRRVSGLWFHLLANHLLLRSLPGQQSRCDG